MFNAFILNLSKSLIDIDTYLWLIDFIYILGVTVGFILVVIIEYIAIKILVNLL